MYDFSFDREETGERSYDAKEGQYTGCRNKDLSDEYTAYGKNFNPDEYDRYQYDRAESTVHVGDTPKDKPCQRLKSCCNNIGRLYTLSKK